MLELMAMKYEFLDHTADVCIRVFGASFSELLKNAADALMDLIVDRETVKLSEGIPFEVNGETREELLVKMLGEILYLHQADKLVFKDIEIRNVARNRVAGILYGEAFDSTRHELQLDIKAATYHNLNIEKVNDRFKVDIVFDI